MLFPEKLRELRKQSGLKQRQLAQLIGVDVPMYCRYEHGERQPKRNQVEKLAKAFRTSPDALVALWLASQVYYSIASDQQATAAMQIASQLITGNNNQATIAPTTTVTAKRSPLCNLVAQMGHSIYPRLIVGSASKVASHIEDASVDCIVTTIPSVTHTKSTQDTHTSTYADFINSILSTMAQMHRVLKPTGSMWLNAIDDSADDGSWQATPWRIALHMIDAQGWLLRNYRQLNAHEYQFHLVKSPAFHHNSDLLKQAYDATKPTSDEHTCQLAIAATCTKGGLVLDPYSGTGTTCKVAYDNDLPSIGIDANPKMRAIAMRRIPPKTMSLF